MSFSKPRTITLTVSFLTLTTNTLLILLFHEFPSDPSHLCRNFTLYLHFANILSIFGFLGALRNHAPSISIFANYLLLDTLFSVVPRFILLILVNSYSHDICSASSIPPAYTTQTQLLAQDNGYEEVWNGESCLRMVRLGELALGAGVVCAMVLQGLGALWVREFARELWGMEGGKRLEVICEEDGEGEGKV